MSADAGAQLIAACVSIYSAPFWQMLRDRGQLSAEAAAESACLAMRGLLNAAAAAGTTIDDSTKLSAVRTLSSHI
jgi:hypothetical protein